MLTGGDEDESKVSSWRGVQQRSGVLRSGMDDLEEYLEDSDAVDADVDDHTVWMVRDRDR